MDDFYSKLAGTLDLDEVNPTDVLEDLPDWDSLAAFTVIAMIGSRYSVHLKAADLKKLGMAENLYDFVAAQRLK